MAFSSPPRKTGYKGSEEQDAPTICAPYPPLDMYTIREMNVMVWGYIAGAVSMLVLCGIAWSIWG